MTTDNDSGDEVPVHKTHEHTGQEPVATLLTPRQLTIAILFGSGLTSKGVAFRAGITPRTARDHLEAIYDRLKIHSRAELAARLAHEGLL